MANKGLSGPEKAAVLMVALGEEVSASVLKKLSPEEIKRLGMEMSNLKKVKKEVYEQILREFLDSFNEDGDIRRRGDEYFRKLVSKSLGQDGQRLIAELESERERIPFKQLNNVEPRVLANAISKEHPQTIALILAHLEQSHASSIISLLSEPLQLEVVSRIANLETVPDELIYEVEEALREGLGSIDGKDRKRVLGGPQIAANILNNCDQKTGQRILEDLESRDEELAEEIRKLMFVFEDLVTVDDRSIREILKEISNDDLLLALKGASADLREKIFKNLSQRAAKMLQEDLEALGPVRLSDVETAQQNILKVAKRLEQEGRIVLASGGGGDVVV